MSRKCVYAIIWTFRVCVCVFCFPIKLIILINPLSTYLYLCRLWKTDRVSQHQMPRVHQSMTRGLFSLKKIYKIKQHSQPYFTRTTIFHRSVALFLIYVYSISIMISLTYRFKVITLSMTVFDLISHTFAFAGNRLFASAFANKSSRYSAPSTVVFFSPAAAR